MQNPYQIIRINKLFHNLDDSRHSTPRQLRRVFCLKILKFHPIVWYDRHVNNTVVKIKVIDK
jgi:hypothetical protein